MAPLAKSQEAVHQKFRSAADNDAIHELTTVVPFNDYF